MILVSTLGHHLGLSLVSCFHGQELLGQGNATIPKLTALARAEHGAAEVARRAHLVGKPRAHFARGLQLLKSGWLARVL